MKLVQKSNPSQNLVTLKQTKSVSLFCTVKTLLVMVTEKQKYNSSEEKNIELEKQTNKKEITELSLKKLHLLKKTIS